jgi:hypothetical protein
MFRRRKNARDMSERALVLGGGGSAGNAWLIGVIAGRLDAGVDVIEADLIIGTSAGATAAAQITTASPAQLVAAILSARVSNRDTPLGEVIDEILCEPQFPKPSALAGPPFSIAVTAQTTFDPRRAVANSGRELCQGPTRGPARLEPMIEVVSVDPLGRRRVGAPSP